MTRHRTPPGTAVNCRSCIELIVWAKTSKGKLMPVDVKPAEDGTFFLFRANNEIQAVHVDSKEPRAERARQRKDKRYRSHIETCVNADKSRRAQ